MSGAYDVTVNAGVTVVVPSLTVSVWLPATVHVAETVDPSPEPEPEFAVQSAGLIDHV